MRRLVRKRQDQIHPLLQEVVSQFFYLSWIIIRIFIYPYIMYTFCRMAHEEVVRTGVLWHWPMLFMPVHFFLCILNLKWSYDLFKPIIMRRLGLQRDNIGVSSGL
jgi:hypothetical protein